MVKIIAFFALFLFAFILIPNFALANAADFSVKPRNAVVVTKWKPDFVVVERPILTLRGGSEQVAGFQTDDDLPGSMGLYENTGGLFSSNNNQEFRFWYNGNTNDPKKGLYRGHFFIYLKDSNWNTVSTVTVPVTVILY